MDDVNLKSFETIQIEGNVEVTLRGTTGADSLIGNDGADTIEEEEMDTYSGIDKTNLFFQQEILALQKPLPIPSLISYLEMTQST